MSKLFFPLLALLACATTGLHAGPLKVFILAGQSNMQGHGRVELGANSVNGEIGSLRYQVENDPANYGHLVDRAGNWKPREDVWIWSLEQGSDIGNPVVEKGDLNVGYGVSDRIGPELGFGHVMGDLFEDQVLLIKTSWGGKSLKVDFRPPRRTGGPGPYYQEMVDTVKDVLANLATEFPDYDAAQGYEIVGFGWHQGWNDRVCQECVDEYEANFEQFILDIRSGRGGWGVSDLPFVVADTGIKGCSESNTRALALMDAQTAVADPVAYPAFAGNVGAVNTQGFWRDPSSSPIPAQDYHWNANAETYYLIGDSMGKAMACLLYDPVITSLARMETGTVELTSNLPVTEVVVQRSDNLARGFLDVPFTIEGNTLCVDAAHVDPGSKGTVFFRLREQPSNAGVCP